MPIVTIGDNTGDDFSGTEDARLRESDPTTNYETSILEVGKYASGNYVHLLIAFSGISNLPGSLSVSSATLYLNQSGSSGDGLSTFNITAKKLNRNWVESETTWNIWSTGNNWTTAGALHETDDRSLTTTFDIEATYNLEYKLFSSAQLASDVEDFADGTLSNYGWHLEQSDAGENLGYKFFSNSESGSDVKPYLSVTYTEVGGGNRIPIIDHHNRMMAMMGS